MEGAEKDKQCFYSFTHAGTSELVTLDHGGGCSQLRRPPSAGQTPGASANHQIVEPGHVGSGRVRGHAAAEEHCVSTDRIRSGGGGGGG